MLRELCQRSYQAARKAGRVDFEEDGVPLALLHMQVRVMHLQGRTKPAERALHVGALVLDAADLLQCLVGVSWDEDPNGYYSIERWTREYPRYPADSSVENRQLSLYQRIAFCASKWPVVGYDGKGMTLLLSVVYLLSDALQQLRFELGEADAVPLLEHLLEHYPDLPPGR